LTTKSNYIAARRAALAAATQYGAALGQDLDANDLHVKLEAAQLAQRVAFEAWDPTAFRVFTAWEVYADAYHDAADTLEPLSVDATADEVTAMISLIKSDPSAAAARQKYEEAVAAAGGRTIEVIRELMTTEDEGK